MKKNAAELVSEICVSCLNGTIRRDILVNVKIKDQIFFFKNHSEVFEINILDALMVKLE